MTLNSQLALFCSVKEKCIWTNWLFHHHVDHIISNWRVKYVRAFLCDGIEKRRREKVAEKQGRTSRLAEEDQSEGRNEGVKATGRVYSRSNMCRFYQ